MVRERRRSEGRPVCHVTRDAINAALGSNHSSSLRSSWNESDRVSYCFPRFCFFPYFPRCHSWGNHPTLPTHRKADRRAMEEKRRLVQHCKAPFTPTILLCCDVLSDTQAVLV